MQNKFHRIFLALLAVIVFTAGCASFQPSIEGPQSRLLEASYSITSNEQIVVTLFNCADTVVLVQEPPDLVGMNYEVEFEGLDGEIEEFSNDYVVTLYGSKIVPLEARTKKDILPPSGTMSFVIKAPKPMKRILHLICHVRRIPLLVVRSLITYKALEECFLGSEEEVVAVPIK